MFFTKKQKEGATGIDIQKGENFDSPRNLLVETRLYLVTEQQKHTYVKARKKAGLGLQFLLGTSIFRVQSGAGKPAIELRKT
jgi:hypothetical protein